jgi:hypothetical protein
MYGERWNWSMTQNRAATTNTAPNNEAREIAFVLRGKICIEDRVDCSRARSAPLPAKHHGVKSRHSRL